MKAGGDKRGRPGVKLIIAEHHLYLPPSKMSKSSKLISKFIKPKILVDMLNVCYGI